MGSVSEDQLAAIELVEEAVTKLYRLNPAHPLLKYRILPDAEAGPDGKPKDPLSEKAIEKEFLGLFWRRETSWEGVPGAVVVMVTFTNYYLALEEAIKLEKRTAQASSSS